MNFRRTIILASLTATACSGSSSSTATGTPDGGVSDMGSDATAPSAGKTLYSGQSQPGILAVDDVNLYWQDEQPGANGAFRIVRGPKPGGSSSSEPSKPVTLATLPAGEQAVQILANGTNVYWTQLSGGPGTTSAAGELVSVPIAGGTTTTLVTEKGQDSLYGQIAIDSSYVYYWVETDKFELNRTPLAGGTPESVASVAFPTGTFSPPIFAGLAVDDTNVYWAQYGFPNDDEVVAKAPKAGGTIVTLYSHDRDGSQLYGCVIDSKNVYWLTSASGTGELTVSSVPLAGGSLGSVGKPTLSNLSGDPPVLPTGLALTNDDFYFTTLEGVVAMPKSGGTARTLALTPLQGDPVFFIADAKTVYWSLGGENPSDGSIVSAPGL